MFSSLPGEALGFMSLRLLVWLWEFSWGGGQRVSASLGSLQQLRDSGSGVVGVAQESRPSGVGSSSPSVFVSLLPSAVNGGGRDLHQHTLLNKTKSGVNSVSVCEHVRGGEGVGGGG